MKKYYCDKNKKKEAVGVIEKYRVKTDPNIRQAYRIKRAAPIVGFVCSLILVGIGVWWDKIGFLMAPTILIFSFLCYGCLNSSYKAVLKLYAPYIVLSDERLYIEEKGLVYKYLDEDKNAITHRILFDEIEKVEWLKMTQEMKITGEHLVIGGGKKFYTNELYLLNDFAGLDILTCLEIDCINQGG